MSGRWTICRIGLFAVGVNRWSHARRNRRKPISPTNNKLWSFFGSPSNYVHLSLKYQTDDTYIEYSLTVRSSEGQSSAMRFYPPKVTRARRPLNFTCYCYMTLCLRIIPFFLVWSFLCRSFCSFVSSDPILFPAVLLWEYRFCFVYIMYFALLVVSILGAQYFVCELACSRSR